jgi:hypothetical protein
MSLRQSTAIVTMILALSHAGIGAQVPVSLEFTTASVMPQGALSEGYSAGSAFGATATLNLGPFMGVSAGIMRSGLSCVHVECAGDASTTIASTVAGIVITPFQSAVRPFLSVGFARSSFEQTGTSVDGKAVAFETEGGVAGPRVGLGGEWVAAKGIAVRLSAYYHQFDDTRPGRKQAQVGPPFGEVVITAIYDGKPIVKEGTDFEVRLMSLQLSVRMNPPFGSQ